MSIRVLPGLFALLCAVLSTTGQGQTVAPAAPALLSTRLFNARDGLPDNKVSQMLETRKNPFRWAVTTNELCRFDGYRFTTVWEKLPDVSGMAENSRGELMLWHFNKPQILSCFDPDSGRKITRTLAEIPGLTGNFLSAWAQDTLIFLVTEVLPERRLDVFRLFPDFKVRLLHSIQLSTRASTFQFPLQTLGVFKWEEKTERLWYSGTLFDRTDVMLRFDRQTAQTDTFLLPGKKKATSPDWISVLITPTGELNVFSSLSNLVWRWNAGSGHFDNTNQKPGTKTGLLCIGVDRKGAIIFRKPDRGNEDLWLLNADGTWRDLQAVLPKLNFTSCVGADFSRQIHFCTLEGVLRANVENPLFKNFTPALPPGTISTAFRGITADAGGNVWLMSEMAGLYRLRPGSDASERVVVREKLSGVEILPSNAVNLQTDAQGFLWSARNSIYAPNLLRIDPETGFCDTFWLRNHSITTFSILKNGAVLAGANDGKTARLFLFDPQARQFRSLTSAGESKNFKSPPLFLLENAAGIVWVGSKEGLALFDPAAKKWLDFAGDGPEAHEFPVAALLAEGDSVLWCGTLGGGLRRLQLQTGAWEIFTMRDGLPANKIAGLVQDENRNLWVSTYDGLSFFQPEAKLFTNFFTANGLLHNEFNRLSFFRNRDGQLFFGGLNGVNFFKPAEVLQSFSQGSDSLLIAQISWFGPDGKTRIEQIFELQNLQKITLPPDNRFCSIRLALANYLLPEANRFSWKLEGYDGNWHLNGTNNEITFHYLPAGKYRLRIRAANPTGVWGKTERYLDIEVREFWYKTAWAIGLFAAAVLCLFYGYYRYRVKRKLEQAENQKIKELDTLKTRLYTNITHEFRTPLTVILGMAEEIEAAEQKKNARADAPIVHAVTLIQRNGKNLLRLINQLLDLSKLDAGLMKTKLVQADVIAYLQYLTESFYSLAQERQVRLTFYPETPSVVMDFDEEKMQIIVFNLLSNALKFTGEGGKVVLHATQMVQNAAPMLQLKVQDTGTGIAEEELPHIFDRFYQVDNSSTRKSEGTGIGLALTKELVELLGGSISVESMVGKGSVFTVILPVKQEAAVKTPLTPAPSTPDHPHLPSSTVDRSSSTEKPLLLVIEDNPDVVTYITGLLKNDYYIETAANGKTGIETAFEIVPDIIISDVMMPEKDGYEVCDTLKNDARTSHIPIILLTAKATQEDKIAGLRVGADAYLQKPFDKSELFVRLEKLIELRQRLRERSAAPPPTAAPTLDDIFLQKIRQVIEARMGEADLGIVHLCRAVSLSHTQVFRKLKALTGENPTLFIRRMRLEHARHLLQTTGMNVSEIAYEVGFSDPNYFSRAFHETFGQAPSAMRN